MNIFQRFYNAIIPSSTGVDTDEYTRLLEFLGIDKSDPKAIQETTYYTCLKILSETMGKLPLKCYVEDSDGGRVRAPTTERNIDLLLKRPNPYMTPATFWTTLEANCQHYGNAYAWIQRRYVKSGRYGGKYETLAYWPMRSDFVTVYKDDAGIFSGKGALYYRYNDPDTGAEYVFRSEDVLHFKTWLTWDGIMGKSVRDILRDTVGGAGHSQKYLSNLYKSGLTASSVLQYTGDLDEQKRKKLQARYNDLLAGAKNAGKVVALPLGMTLTPLNYKLSDSQFVELKKYSALQIAAAFGVKPNQINDYERSSYANSEAQQLAFLIDTMLFRLNIYEQEINYKCLTQEQKDANYVFKINEKALLRADSQTQMNTITSGVQNGIYTPNEGRHLLDLPSEKGGDVLIVNGNYVPLSGVGAAYGISQEGGSGA
ncbi:MAG: phage portal protein [Eubacterium sp.]|nr:phage portal protein [Candidatus Colimonas fimequi]